MANQSNEDESDDEEEEINKESLVFRHRESLKSVCYRGVLVDVDEITEHIRSNVNVHLLFPHTNLNVEKTDIYVSAWDAHEKAGARRWHLLRIRHPHSRCFNCRPAEDVDRRKEGGVEFASFRIP